MLRNDGLEQMPTAAILLNEVECVAAVEALKAVQEARGEEASLKTPVAAAMSPEEEEVP